MSRYYRSLVLNRGASVRLTLTFACTLDCPYCCLKLPNDKRTWAKPVGLEEWKEFVRRFPLKVREYHVGGGEPTLFKWMPEFVNWLMDRGHHVTLYTNLSNPQITAQIKNSRRFTIISTYHHAVDIDEYKKAYYHLTRLGYEVRTYELTSSWKKDASGYVLTEDSPKLLPFSRIRGLIVDFDYLKKVSLDERQFIVSPDQLIYSGCWEMIADKDGTKPH